MRKRLNRTRWLAGSVLCLFSAQIAVASFPLVAEDPASPVLSFESNELPGSLQPAGGSAVELAGRHYLNGSQSLNWKWSGPSELYFNRKIPFVSNQKAFEQPGTRV